MSPTSARTAATVAYTARTTGTGCLVFAFAPLVWELRRPDGTLQTVPPAPPPSLPPFAIIDPPATRILLPGETAVFPWTIWSGMAPGVYRVDWIDGATVPFTILA